MRRPAARLLWNGVLGLVLAGLAWFAAGARWDRPEVSRRPPWEQSESTFHPVAVSPWLAPLLLVLAVGVALRWRWPRTAFVATVLGVGGYLASGAVFGPVLLAPALTAYAMARSLPLRRWVPLAALLVPMIVVGHLRDPYLGLFDPALYAQLVFGVGLAVVPALVALLRQQRRASDELQREQDRRRYAYEERLRIARDVHDVVGHSLSVITMQAGVARHVLEKGQTQEANASLEAIRQTSKQALDELRTTLAVFRSAEGDGPRTPQPGLARLDDLVGALRAAGREVELVREPAVVADGLPASVDQAAFRIVQEALTNVVRHAGPAASTVRVRRTSASLLLEVLDDGPVTVAPVEGNGLRGMRERARAVGGEVSLTPRTGGGMILVAELPVGPTTPRSSKRSDA